jgi:5-methylcytosine-specific restriction enzyme A
LYISNYNHYKTLLMNNQWTDSELKKAILAYFEMLQYEKKKTPYVKAEVNRKLQAKIPQRNSKNIEYRWQNISSVLNDNKIPFINGFKPARNVGSNVKERIWKIINDLKLVE